MMRRARVNHFAIAATCRAHPGEWQRAGEYNSSQSAAGAAGYIRSAYAKQPSQTSAWAPAGAFEARQVLTEFGARVEVRYVGDRDAMWADALAAVTGGAE